MASLEHTIQSWWLASIRLHDCAGDEFTMAELADFELQHMAAGERRGAVK